MTMQYFGGDSYSRNISVTIQINVDSDLLIDLIIK